MKSLGLMFFLLLGDPGHGFDEIIRPMQVEGEFFEYYIRSTRHAQKEPDWFAMEAAAKKEFLRRSQIMVADVVVFSMTKVEGAPEWWDIVVQERRAPIGADRAPMRLIVLVRADGVVAPVRKSDDRIIGDLKDEFLRFLSR